MSPRKAKFIAVATMKYTRLSRMNKPIATPLPPLFSYGVPVPSRY